MTYTDIDQLPLVLTVTQLAAVLGLGKSNTYALVCCGRIRSIRIGHQIKIPKAAVVEFLTAEN
jgi:excisionase family DNA binding protein